MRVSLIYRHFGKKQMCSFSTNHSFSSNLSSGYVYLVAWVNVCPCAWLPVWMCTFMLMCLYVCVHGCLCAREYVCLYLWAYVNVWLCTCVPVCLYICFSYRFRIMIFPDVQAIRKQSTCAVKTGFWYVTYGNKSMHERWSWICPVSLRCVLCAWKREETGKEKRGRREEGRDWSLKFLGL